MGVGVTWRRGMWGRGTWGGGGGTWGEGYVLAGGRGWWLNGMKISQIDLFTKTITNSSQLLYITNSYC